MKKHISTLERIASGLLAVLLMLALAAPALAAAGDTTRISISSTGEQASSSSLSYNPDISADGRYVAFYTYASWQSTEIPGKCDPFAGQIFVRDTVAHTSTIASVNSNGECAGVKEVGVPAPDFGPPSISDDGRYVVFVSDAKNLVAGDTNAGDDVFLHDAETGVTSRISVSTSGAQANSSMSKRSFISGNGRYVAFGSYADNLVDGDTNYFWDAFVRDTALNTTTRVSVASNGGNANGYSSPCSISADGRFVAIQSNASNLVGGDTNYKDDVFVRDTVLNTTTLISVSSSGEQGNAVSWNCSMSHDGRYVAFLSDANNLVDGDTNGPSSEDGGDVFVRDTLLNTTTRVSVDSSGAQANGASWYPAISPDGHSVAFASLASNLVANDTNATLDVFMHNLLTHTTTRVSVNSSGEQGNGKSGYEKNFGGYGDAISAEGKYVVFTSHATNLVAGDTNGAGDIFRHENQPSLPGDTTPPTVISITRVDPNPSTAANVRFAVLFSEVVTGVDAADFSLTTGGISGTAVAGVSGSGTTYTVTASTGTGSGTLRLDVTDNDTIVDLAGNPLGGTSTGNGNFNTGEAYLIRPSATIFLPLIVR